MLRQLRKTRLNKSATGQLKKALLHQPRQAFLTNFLKTPIKHLKAYIEPNADNYNPHVANTTEEGFDEEGHEWQALVTENAFDLNLHQDYEYIAGNFGTVDNPILVFTVDSPWRWVICCGPADEDEMVSHEALWFLLREGPINRCHHCGNCYKLVRLKDEFNFENDYYQPHFVPISLDDMGEYDNIYQSLNIFRGGYWQQHATDNETPSNIAYIMVNQDDHDRLLTDPAYRMEKTADGHRVIEAFHESLLSVEQEYLETNGAAPRIPLWRGDYETMIDIEKAIHKMDNIFAKVDKFNSRSLADPDNHERREKRMEAKKAQRWQSKHTYFFGELTEEEQMQRDYYQTDAENEEKQDDNLSVLQSGYFDPKKYDFIEPHLHNPEEVVQDHVDEKVFRFKYRAAADEERTYWRRQNRMITRSLERAQKRKVDGDIAGLLNEVIAHDIGDRTEQLHQSLKPYRDWAIEESALQYKDYYESDAEADAASVDDLNQDEKIRMLQVFQDFTRKEGSEGYVSIPKKEYDINMTWWERVKGDYYDYRYRVLPEVQKHALHDNLADCNLEDASVKLSEWKKRYGQIEDKFRAEDEELARLTKEVLQIREKEFNLIETDHDKKMRAQAEKLATMSPKELEFYKFKQHIRRVLSDAEWESRKEDLTEEALRLAFEEGWALSTDEPLPAEYRKQTEASAKALESDPVIKSLLEAYDRNQKVASEANTKETAPEK